MCSEMICSTLNMFLDRVTKTHGNRKAIDEGRLSPEGTIPH